MKTQNILLNDKCIALVPCYQLNNLHLYDDKPTRIRWIFCKKKSDPNHPFLKFQIWCNSGYEHSTCSDSDTNDCGAFEDMWASIKLKWKSSLGIQHILLYKYRRETEGHRGKKKTEKTSEWSFESGDMKCEWNGRWKQSNLKKKLNKYLSKSEIKCLELIRDNLCFTSQGLSGTFSLKGSALPWGRVEVKKYLDDLAKRKDEMMMKANAK